MFGQSIISNRFFVSFEVRLDLLQEARLEGVWFETVEGDGLPLAGNQYLRIDEGIDRFLQAVDPDLVFHRDHFFDDPRYRVARNPVTMIDNGRALLQSLQHHLD